MSRLAIVDPMTLMGQAVTTEIQKLFPEVDFSFFHSSEEEEHQIASVGGNPALVPPLSESENLADFEIIILTSDTISPRLKVLEKALDENSTLTFIDASFLKHYRHLTTPVLGVDPVVSGSRVRPAHPSIVVAAAVLQAIRPQQPATLTIGSIEPASIYGTAAVTTLAHQAAQRLQGEDVTKKIDDQVIAFNMTAREGDDLSEEAAILFPKIDTIASRTLGGAFHGHVTLLSMVFAAPVDQRAVNKTFTAAPTLSLTKTPLHLDRVSDRKGIWLTSPEFSPGGTTMVLQAMVDGTQIGGGETVAEIVKHLMEN